ncbi:MAG: hypothetical protein MR687_04160 [Spirochaetales bacterium]|nr:hypothetical protein [Spirochaetales bacterium]
MGKEKKAKKEKKVKVAPYANKRTLTVYLVLRALVIAVMVRAFFRGAYENMFMCGLTLVLMILPSILTKKLKIYLPSALEIVILCFIFAAEILGEISSFYINVPHWDTMLHTINGFLCAAVGFALVDLFNRDERFTFKLSPLFLAVVAFCFSMTIGVLWEFFEFSADHFFATDMQKDTIVRQINTVELDETRTNKVVKIKNIDDVIIVHSDGTEESLGLGGYLDIGIIDTMKDLFVNFIGAVVFSILGFIYVKTRGKGKIASSFIPRVEMNDRSLGEEEKKEDNQEN